jgi:hypothetical protein
MREVVFSLPARNELIGSGIFQPHSDVETDCNVRLAETCEPLKVALRQVETTSNVSSGRFDGFCHAWSRIADASGRAAILEGFGRFYLVYLARRYGKPHDRGQARGTSDHWSLSGSQSTASSIQSHLAKQMRS